MVALFLGLAFYGFDFATRVPLFMHILMKFSYIRVSVIAMVLTVFGFDRLPLDCDEIYCHFGDPRVLIKFLDINKTSLLMQFFFLLLLWLFFRALVDSVEPSIGQFNYEFGGSDAEGRDFVLTHRAIATDHNRESWHYICKYVRPSIAEQCG